MLFLFCLQIHLIMISRGFSWNYRENFNSRQGCLGYLYLILCFVNVCNFICDILWIHRQEGWWNTKIFMKKHTFSWISLHSQWSINFKKSYIKVKEWCQISDIKLSQFETYTGHPDLRNLFSFLINLQTIICNEMLVILNFWVSLMMNFICTFYNKISLR